MYQIYLLSVKVGCILDIYQSLMSWPICMNILYNLYGPAYEILVLIVYMYVEVIYSLKVHLQLSSRPRVLNF